MIESPRVYGLVLQSTVLQSTHEYTHICICVYIYIHKYIYIYILIYTPIDYNIEYVYICA